MNILEANQGRPYDIFKLKILNKNTNKEYISIILGNLEKSGLECNLEEFLDSLNKKGCTCAMFANVLGNFIYNSNISNDQFIDIFGFSPYLNDTGLFDYNKIMLDIYSKFYKCAKVKTISYKSFLFDSPQKAVLDLFGEKIVKKEDAFIYLFNKGIISDGISDEMLKFKYKYPKIKTYVGNFKKVGKDLFGIEVNSFEELKQLGKKNNINIEISDYDINMKLSGLLKNNFNFWSDYYFDTLNLPFKLEKENSEVLTKEDIFDYVYYPKDYFLEVSVNNNKNVFMHKINKKSYTRVGSDEAGHSMLFKGLDCNDDLIVSSYGCNYVIPIDFIGEIEFAKIRKVSKNKVLKEEPILENNKTR